MKINFNPRDRQYISAYLAVDEIEPFPGLGSEIRIHGRISDCLGNTFSVNVYIYHEDKRYVRGIFEQIFREKVLLVKGGFFFGEGRDGPLCISCDEYELPCRSGVWSERLLTNMEKIIDGKEGSLKGNGG